MRTLEGIVRDKKEIARRWVAGKLIDVMNRSDTGKAIMHAQTEKYFGGHSLEEGLQSAANLYKDQDFRTSMDVLGEDAHTIEDADGYVSDFLNSIRWIRSHLLQNAISVSLKPSAVCGIKERQEGDKKVFDGLLRPLEPTLDIIVNFAKMMGVKVTLDMEDHNYTNISLKAAQYIWNKGYDNFGIVVQSRLDRTEGDINWLFNMSKYSIPMNSIRVRSVLGIYPETSEIASGKSEGKQRLVKRISELFDAGVYVEIATHNAGVIDTIINDIIKPRNIPKDRYEFQFLKGVRSGEAKGKELKDEGEIVRYYWPFETKAGAGIPYGERRAKANPDFIKYAVWDVLNSFRKNPTETTKEIFGHTGRKAA